MGSLGINYFLVDNFIKNDAGERGKGKCGGKMKKRKHLPYFPAIVLYKHLLYIKLSIFICAFVDN